MKLLHDIFMELWLYESRHCKNMKEATKLNLIQWNALNRNMDNEINGNKTNATMKPELKKPEQNKTIITLTHDNKTYRNTPIHAN